MFIFNFIFIITCIIICKTVMRVAYVWPLFYLFRLSRNDLVTILIYYYLRDIMSIYLCFMAFLMYMLSLRKTEYNQNV